MPAIAVERLERAFADVKAVYVMVTAMAAVAAFVPLGALSLRKMRRMGR